MTASDTPLTSDFGGRMWENGRAGTVAPTTAPALDQHHNLEQGGAGMTRADSTKTPAETVCQASEYTVHDAVLGDDDDRHLWTIKVVWRGPDDQWAVTSHGSCWNRRTKAWDYEPMPSSRTDAYKRTHRFPLEQALQIAREQAPLLRINNMTAADLIARKAAR